MEGFLQIPGSRLGVLGIQRAWTQKCAELAIGGKVGQAERGKRESGRRPEVAPQGVLEKGGLTSPHPSRLTDGSAAQEQAVGPGRCQGQTEALLCALLRTPRVGRAGKLRG